MRSRPWRLACRTLLVLGALLSVSCRGRRPDAPPDVVRDQADIPSVSSRLQVVSLDPAVQAPDVEFPARVYGGGFTEGVRVTIGDRSAREVRRVDENTLAVIVPGLPTGTYDVTAENAAGERSILRGGLTVRAGTAGDCRLVTVHFGFDDAGLDGTAQGVLDEHVACWQGGAGPLRLEGHADSRGTTDYNLALGQRRAETVRRHLTSRGIAQGRIRTLSYGEERPVDPGNSEAAWARNRRVEIHASQ